MNTKANIEKSRSEYKGRISNAAAIGIPGAVTLGGSAGLKALEKANHKKFYAIGFPFPYFDSNVGLAIGGLGTAAGGYHLAKGLAAKRRTTPMGHAKAKFKADNFRDEMKQAFKGTKYAKLPGSRGENAPYNYESTSTQWKNAAVGQRQPKSKIVNPPKTSNLSRKDQKTVNDAMKRWADTFEKQYQAGLSKGMTHEQAERYSNDYIAKNGFGSAQKKKRR